MICRRSRTNYLFEKRGVHAHIVVLVLLRDAGVFTEICGGKPRQKQYGALHPHVHREVFCAVQTVEQSAVCDFWADA